MINAIEPNAKYFHRRSRGERLKERREAGNMAKHSLDIQSRG